MRITLEEDSRAIVKDWLPGTGAEGHAVSALIEATRPRASAGQDPVPPACCDSVLFDTCCPPESKPGCCDAERHEAGACGCR